MMLALAWLMLAAVSGTLLTWRYLDDASLSVRMVGGSASGLVLAGLVGYAVSAFLKLGVASNVVTVLILATPGLWLRQPEFRERILQSCRWPSRSVMAAWLLLTVTVVPLFCDAVYMKRLDNEEFASIYTGYDNNLGDLPMHLNLTTSFWPGQNIPPQDIEFAGVRMAYPFLVDYETGQLYSLGGPLIGVMTLHNLVMAVILFSMLMVWGTAFTGDTRAGIATPWLVLFSGGLGFMRLLSEARYNPAEVARLLPHLTHNYTIQETGLRWGNSLITLLVPQRGLLLGLPCMLWVIYLLWRSVALPAGPARNRLALGAGGLVASLVLAHTYAALVAGGMGLVLAVLFPDARSWARFLAASLLLSLPQVLWLTVGSSMQTAHFFAWHPGWDHGDDNPLRFWLYNTGILLPLLCVGLVHNPEPGARTRLRFYLPFLLCFIVPNLFRLAPWIWDNIKVLYPWFLISVPWVALVLAAFSRTGPGGVVLAVALAVVLCLSGMLDVWRVVSGASELKVFEGADVAFADQLEKVVPPGAVVMHAPTYNPPTCLSGSRSLLGYTGHIVSRGVDLGTREADQALMYQGTGGAWDLLARYHVDYVLVTWQERHQYPVNDSFLDRFPKILDWRGYRLYQIPHI